MWAKLKCYHPNKYYLYYCDHGLDIEDCIQFQDEIKEFIRYGWLDRFLYYNREQHGALPTLPWKLEPPQLEVATENQPAIRIINRQHSQLGVLADLFKRQKIEEAITFSKKDAHGIHFPHNDVVVVNLNTMNYDVCYILVDNGSSVKILHFVK